MLVRDSVMWNPFLLTKKYRKWVVFFWSLAPWSMLYVGLHYFHSIIWSFALYHGVCLVPAIILNRSHWMKHLERPKVRDLMWWGLAVVGFSTFTYVTYYMLGNLLVDRRLALISILERGFHFSWFIPLSIYFLTINPILEEFFWRGVVLNELCDNEDHLWSPSCIWTNFAFSAWHFLVVRLFVSPPFVPVAVIVVLSVGFFMSWMYRRKNTLVLPVLWHSMVFDLAVIIILAMVLYAPTLGAAEADLRPLLNKLQ